MKRYVLTFISILVALGIKGQLPKWIINPNNDTIFVKIDNNLLQSISEGESSLWTFDGKLLYKTSDNILPFNNGVATIVKKNQNKIVGLVDQVGNFTSFSDLPIEYENPYFEDGLLLSKNNDEYAYFKKDGSKAEIPSTVRSYPFHKGYATYFTYDNQKKKKDPHYGYFKSNGKEVEYKININNNIKKLESKDIQFLSSIGDNGKGIAVINDKIYEFFPETDTFKPMMWNDDSNKKQQLTIIGHKEQDFIDIQADNFTINAKYGKNKTALLRFNQELLPQVFFFGEKRVPIISKGSPRYNYSSELDTYLKNARYGLSLKAKEVIPPQFEDVGLRFGRKAFVKINGKWGLIEIIPNLDYSIKINKGEDIAFRHQKFETQIRLDLPSEITAQYANIDIPENTGLILDKTSRETKDTDSGNFLTYNCILNIPDSLPDTVTTITYEPVTVSYGGMSLFEIPISIKAWHYKYYNVDPIESETSISDGVASFTININAQRNPGEIDYPFEVKIEADSVNTAFEKLSETRYKCLVSNLQEGDNSLNILITEKGCPPSVFPFEIVYTKPVPKKKKKEEVVVRKVTPLPQKNTSRIEL